MSESNLPDPLCLHEKGPVYSKLMSKVSDTSEGGLETILEIPGTVPAFFHAQVRIQLQHQTDETAQHQAPTTFLECVPL